MVVGVEYVKVLVGADGRVHGAVLVGETDLEVCVVSIGW